MSMENNFLEKSYIFNSDNVDFSGKVITLKRNIKLAKYNDYETEAKSIDWQVRCDSEDREFDTLSFRILKTFYDRFILTATSDGLSRYEKILGINGDNKSLEERRKKVFLLWNKQIRYTDRSLRAMLDVIYGSGNYNMTLFYNEYGIMIEILANRSLNLNELYSMLRKDILPVNLEIELRIKAINGLVFREKTDAYTNRLYPVSTYHQCGSIYKHQYVGKKINSNIKLPNGARNRSNRKVFVGERKAGARWYLLSS